MRQMIRRLAYVVVTVMAITPVHAFQERETVSGREMGLRDHVARDTASPSDLVDLDVNIQLYGVAYTITVGPYDRFAAEDVARTMMVNGLRYTNATTVPPANYLYAPNTIRYVAFRTVP